MHQTQRLGQRRQVQTAAQPLRQQVHRSFLREQGQRLANQGTQARLLKALGARVDRGKPLRERGRRAIFDTGVLGMHHLQAIRAVAHFAEAAQARARGQLFHLRHAEVEKAQHQSPATVVGERHLELRPKAEASLDGLHHALDLHALTGQQLGDGGDAGAVFPAQRQMEPQVLDRVQADPGQRLLKRGTDAAQRAQTLRAGTPFRDPGHQSLSRTVPGCRPFPRAPRAAATRHRSRPAPGRAQ